MENGHCFSPVVSVHPKLSLFDQMVDIRVSGLRSSQEVTLRVGVVSECGRFPFESSATYRADIHGEISVQKDPSLGGSYEGIEPHGFLWSLKPVAEVAKKYPKLGKSNVTTPFVYSLDVLDRGLKETVVDTEVIATTTFERWYLADYVDRIPMTIGRAEGVLFIPKENESSPGQLPVVLDVRGLVDPMVEDRPALVASHGFAVFAYNYFYPILRETGQYPVMVELTVFDDILKFISEHPRLDVERVGINCSCVGAGLVFHAATKLDLPIKCIAAAGFVDVPAPCYGLTLPDGSEIKPYTHVKAVKDDDGKLWLHSTQNDSVDRLREEHVAKFEKLTCPLQVFAHGDEGDFAFKWRADFIKERMEEAGNADLLEYHLLPGTGHYLHAPFLPNSPISVLKVPVQFGPLGYKQVPALVRFGGWDAKQNAVDQEFAWRKIINFLGSHLGVSKSYRNDWFIQ